MEVTITLTIEEVYSVVGAAANWIFEEYDPDRAHPKEPVDIKTLRSALDKVRAAVVEDER